jgi:hypothetical protein
MVNMIPRTLFSAIFKKPVGFHSSSVLSNVNPLNTELNPIVHLLELSGAHHILHISGIKVN